MTGTSVADSGADDLTLRLAASLSARRARDMPDAVVREGCRALLDWLGCALAASRHPTMDILMRTLEAVAPAPMATVLGRGKRLGLLEAALANGQMGHLLDYDDTLITGTNVIHAGSPILAALLALAEIRPASGMDFLLALATGFDAGVRVAAAVPGHIDKGWHGTGTLGSFCAGAAAAALLGLDATRFARALAIAGTQAAGMQQNRGTMCKSFHAGKAASNGVLAALLAEGGFTSSLEIVEGRLGFGRLYADAPVPDALVEELEGHWAITGNGYKPYACGFVVHPAIDGILEIRRRAGLPPEAIERIEIEGHRHLLTVTGTRHPATGLQSKFSTHHSAAVAYVDGAAGFSQYTDGKATDPLVHALRERTEVTTHDRFTKGQAVVRIRAGGRTWEHRVEHASGTRQNPMSDAAIQDKFMANAAATLGTARAKTLAEAVWALPGAEDAAGWLRL